MRNRKGFTLTEVLLAAAIVGIIGVALASLTTAASRESGAGSSRVMLRNSLSVAIRQLRQDVHSASRALFAIGEMATATTTAANQTPLLVLAKNSSVADEVCPHCGEKQYIAYCFERVVSGNTTLSSGDSIQPTFSGSTDNSVTTDGGTIYRVVWSAPQADYCPANAASSGAQVSTWLRNVKFISSNYGFGEGNNSHYPVPLFLVRDFKGDSYSGNLDGQGARLEVKLIVELPSYPVVNETIEKKLLFTNGGRLKDPD